MQVLFKNIANEITGQIDSATSKINIAVAWFTNEEIFDSLLQKLKSGVAVELIIIDDLINNSELGLDFQRFIDSGGSLYFGNPENLMHHKFCLIDDRVLLNGSYNWTYFAEYRNLENLMVVEQREVVVAFQQEFESIKSGVHKVEKLKRNSIQNISDDQSFRALIADDISLKSFKKESIGSYDKAITLAKRAMEINPANKNIERQINTLQLKKTQSSSPSFIPSATLIDNKKFLAFNTNLKSGIKEYKKKNFHDAKQYFQRALEERPDYAELYYWIGLCHLRLGEFDPIIQLCDNALKINAKYSVVYNLRGIAYSEKGNIEKALEDFNHAILYNQSFYKAFFNRALIHQKKSDSLKEKEDLNATINILNTVIKSNSQDEDALSLRGDAFSMLGDVVKAKEDYKRAEEIFEGKRIDDKDLNNEQRIKEGLAR